MWSPEVLTESSTDINVAVEELISHLPVTPFTTIHAVYNALSDPNIMRTAIQNAQTVFGGEHAARITESQMSTSSTKLKIKESHSTPRSKPEDDDQEVVEPQKDEL